MSDDQPRDDKGRFAFVDGRGTVKSMRLSGAVRSAVEEHSASTRNQQGVFAKGAIASSSRPVGVTVDKKGKVTTLSSDNHVTPRLQSSGQSSPAFRMSLHSHGEKKSYLPRGSLIGQKKK